MRFASGSRGKPYPFNEEADPGPGSCSTYIYIYMYQYYMYTYLYTYISKYIWFKTKFNNLSLDMMLSWLIASAKENSNQPGWIMVYQPGTSQLSLVLGWLLAYSLWLLAMAKPSCQPDHAKYLSSTSQAMLRIWTLSERQSVVGPVKDRDRTDLTRTSWGRCPDPRG